MPCRAMAHLEQVLSARYKDVVACLEGYSTLALMRLVDIESLKVRSNRCMPEYRSAHACEDRQAATHFT